MVINKDILFRRIFFICFWIWACFGFIQDEILPFLKSVQPIVQFGLDFVFLLLGLCCIKQKQDVLYILIFTLFAYVSTCLLNNLSLLNFVNGYRDFIPLVVSLPILRYLNRTKELQVDFNRTFDRQLLLFLILQVPCVLFQFLKYGANDHGGGTLGNWNSGIVSTSIYLISFYLVSKKWDSSRFIDSLINNKWYILLLLPTFFNETKVSFLFLIAYFLFLMKVDAKIVLKLLWIVPIMSVILYLLFNVYISATGNNDAASLDYYEEYLWAGEHDNQDLITMFDMLENDEFEDDDWYIDIARFSRIMLMPTLLEESTKGGLLCGGGLSHFKGGTVLEQTNLAKEYKWFFTGTIPYLVFVIAQLGLFGFVLCIWRYFPLKILKRKNISKNVVFYAMFVIAVIMVYNTSLNTAILNILIFNMFLNGAES